MEKVLGFGGLFFRSENPERLAQWYRDHLGIDLVPKGPEDAPWMARGGATVFAPFAKDTTYFPATSSFMINFRVENLDAMLAQLEAMGVAAKLTDEMAGVGRFGQLADPEGNPIELWEPEATT